MRPSNEQTGSASESSFPRRILIVTQHYWPEVGGAEVMLRRLANLWSQEGRDVTVVTCGWDARLPDVEQDSGTQVIRRRFRRLRVLGTLNYMRDLAAWLSRQGHRHDAWLVSMLKHGAFVARRAANKFNRPVVFRAEGAGVTGDVAWLAKAWGGGLIRTSLASSTILAPSREIAEELRGAGFASDRIIFAPNGVPIPAEPWSRADCSHWRARLGLVERPTIAFVGRLHPDKGVADLVAAAPIAARTIGPLQILFVGDGPAANELRQQVAALPSSVLVKFCGEVADPSPFLRASDAFALPSYQEGLSLALLEAMALGAPVIASDIAAHRGLFPDQLVPLVPPRQPALLAIALVKTLLTSAAREADGQARRREIHDRFSAETCAAIHLEAMRAAAGQFESTGRTAN